MHGNLHGARRECADAILVLDAVEKSLVPKEVAHIQNFLHLSRLRLFSFIPGTGCLMCDRFLDDATDNKVHGTPREALGDDVLPRSESGGLHALQHVSDKRHVLTIREDGHFRNLVRMVGQEHFSTERDGELVKERPFRTDERAVAIPEILEMPFGAL